MLSWHVTTGSTSMSRLWMAGVGRCIGVSSIYSTHHQSSIICIHHCSNTRNGDGNVDTRYAAKSQTGKIQWQTFSSVWPSQLQSTDKVAEGAPHLRDFPRPRRGPRQPSDSFAEEARDPVMALHPKWCPTMSLRLSLRYGVVDDSQSNIICKHGITW